MYQKLNSQDAFTLAETLITVLILLMVSAVVAGGIPAAANAYRKAVDAANAHVLLSTTVNALRSELKGTTIIMIAQRIASVMQADKIAVIENGTITAGGPHAELMKTSAAYQDIYNSQLKNGGDER